MAMLAMSEAECQEILALFRQHLPHVPDDWLQELAANYELDAVADIDPMDVIAVLSGPGRMHRILLPLSKLDAPTELRYRIRSEFLARNIEPENISASLLAICDSSLTIVDVRELVAKLACECPKGVMKAWAWYAPKNDLARRALTWILVCQ